jgi:hypothetical protein
MITMLERSTAVRSSQDSKHQRDIESKLGVMEGRCRMAEKEVERLKIDLSAAEARLDVTQKLSAEQSKVMSGMAVLERSSAEGHPLPIPPGSPAASVGTQQMQGEHGLVPPPPPFNTSIHEAELKQMRVEREVKKREYVRAKRARRRCPSAAEAGAS